MARVQNWLALARSGTDGVRQVQEVGLASAAVDEARLAALALARAGSAESEAALIDALGATDESVRSVVLEVVAAMPSPARLAAVGTRLPADDSPWLRRRVAEVLAASSDPAAHQAVLDAFDDPDPGVRGVATRHVQRTLRALPAKPWLGRLASACADLAAEVAWYALIAVGEHGDPAHAADVRAALDHPNAFVVGQAEVQLARLVGGPLPTAGVPVDLDGIRALRDTVDAHVRLAVSALRLASTDDAILAAIGRLAGSAASIATTALAQAAELHPRAEARRQALRALDGRRGDGVWRAIRHVVATELDPERRRSTVWTLARRTEPEAFALLVELAAHPTTDSGSEAVAGLAARVHKTARARTPESEGVLTQALRAGEPPTRMAAASALARFRTDGAAAALTAALATEADPEVRATLAEALGRRA